MALPNAPADVISEALKVSKVASVSNDPLSHGYVID